MGVLAASFYEARSEVAGPGSARLRYPLLACS